MSKLKDFDDSYRQQYGEYIAGFDEAGRGPLCGNVCCAMVVFKSDFDSSLINDSKKLTEKKRLIALEDIKKNAVFYTVKSVSNKVIDEINILEASRLGMQMCLDEAIEKKIPISCLLTDCMKLKNTYNIPLFSFIKGDASSLAIAASSIVAKTTRDSELYLLDQKFPQYEFRKNKGYATKRHLELLDKYGVIKDIYRLSFKPVQERLEKPYKLFD